MIGWLLTVIGLAAPLMLMAGGEGTGGADGGTSAEGASEAAPTGADALVGESLFAELEARDANRAAAKRGRADALAAEQAGGEAQAEAAEGTTDAESADAAAESGAGDDKAMVPKARMDAYAKQLTETRESIPGLIKNAVAEALKAAGVKGAGEADVAQPVGVSAEAWRAQLKPLPKMDYKLIDPAKPDVEVNRAQWADAGEYAAALAAASSHNALVERDGRAEQAKTQETAKQAELEETAWRTQQLAKSDPARPDAEQTVAFLKEEGISHAAFIAKLNTTPKIEGISDLTAQAIAGAVRLYSDSSPRFLARMSETPAPVLQGLYKELDATPQHRKFAAITAMVGRLDALAAQGLTFDGKPKPVLTKGKAPAQSRSTSTAVPDGKAGAAVADESQLSGEALFKHLEAKDARKHQQRMARRAN